MPFRMGHLNAELIEGEDIRLENTRAAIKSIHYIEITARQTARIRGSIRESGLFHAVFRFTGH